MRYEMNLRKEYFNYIKNGTKRVEMRLFDEKRSKIQIGDEIKFWTSKEGSREEVLTRVVGLSRYRDFEELVGDFEVEMPANAGTTKARLLADLDKFYSREAKEKCGVVGIRFELVDETSEGNVV